MPFFSENALNVVQLHCCKRVRYPPKLDLVHLTVFWIDNLEG